MGQVELAPRWEWVDVSAFGDQPATTFVKGYCKHLEQEPVTDVTGEQVAVLCRTCDQGWRMDGSPTR